MVMIHSEKAVMEDFTRFKGDVTPVHRRSWHYAVPFSYDYWGTPV